MSSDVIAIRCNWCTRQLQPFRVHQLPSLQFICDDCFDWNLHAIDVLGGAMPKGCQDCGRNISALDCPGSVELRMYVVPRDGILQVLCGPCKDRHVAKTPHLYAGTEYGSKTLKL